MCTKQRLVVCLDGTWNNKDDSTNVLQHFALALHGAPASGKCNGVVQNKHYIAGVGTGVLDRITGGGFAIGLEENVRAAYDWLVENYHDDGNPDDADEIFIFGFSRGAFTARSLVGFIATCGLLRRGAPLSVNQLWDDYCVLGRQREHAASIWDWFDTPKNKAARITDLICDPWNTTLLQKFPAQKGIRSQAGQFENDYKLKNSERLLVKWSRRARITYLGLYDTVGAVGFDALAIPGLRSRMAMHHNMRPSRLIQHCRHALALDEHRSSFKHTPLVEYIGCGGTEDDVQSELLKNASSSSDQDYWQKQSADWKKRIEQRWFVGAHSNVGGGYPDNELAQRPLAWLLEGARNARLECEPFTFDEPNGQPDARDSYTEFGKSLWVHAIRGKRCYRPIDPEPELKASRPVAGEHNGHHKAGFSLNTINEDVDPSVYARVATCPDYRPPNLVEYARRKGVQPPIEPTSHAWMGNSAVPYAILVLWATCASFGLLPLIELFAPDFDLSPTWYRGFQMGLIALAFVLVDWSESRANFSLAIQPSDARWRALFDSVYWSRTIGVALFILGAVSALTILFVMGWNGDGLAFRQAICWMSVPSLAGAGVLLANALDRSQEARTRAGIAGMGLGLLVVGGSAIAALGLGWLLQHLITPSFGRYEVTTLVSPAPKAHAAGLLLLLELATVYFVIALRWVGEPLKSANLGGITSLQTCRTPKQVKQVFEHWRKMLANHWSGADKDATGPAGQAMCDRVRQALWRDIFGFIPVYVMTLSFAAWCVVQELSRPPLFAWIGGLHIGSVSIASLVPLIVWLPFVAAVADYIEDTCHLRYVSLYGRRKSIPSWLTMTSFAASAVKLTVFGASLACVPIGLVFGAIDVAWLGDTTGWRGTIALSLIVLVFAAVTAIVVGAIRTWWSRHVQQNAGEKVAPAGALRERRIG